MLVINGDTVVYPVAAFAVLQREHLVTRHQELFEPLYTELVDRLIDPDALDTALETDMDHQKQTYYQDRRPQPAVGRAVDELIPIYLQERLEHILAEQQEPLEVLMADTHLSVSEPRVVGVIPDPVREVSEYEQRRLGDGSRPILGIYYLPNQSWSIEDSLLTYMEIVSELRDNQVAAEEASDIFGKMMVKLKRYLWQDGELNRAFANELDKRGFTTSYTAPRLDESGQPISQGELRVKIMKERKYPDLFWRV